MLECMWLCMWLCVNAYTHSFWPLALHYLLCWLDVVLDVDDVDDVDDVEEVDEVDEVDEPPEWVLPPEGDDEPPADGAEDDEPEAAFVPHDDDEPPLQESVVPQHTPEPVEPPEALVGLSNISLQPEEVQQF